MKIRALKRSDFKRVDEIYRQHHQEEFSLPNLSNIVTCAVVETKKGVIGYGVVKLFAEAIMVLDLDESVADRLDAMEILMREAFRGCQEQGITQLHVFVKNPKLERILEKHYEFKKAEGVALVREL